MEESFNKILAGLEFNISPAITQLQTLADLASKAALSVQEQFARAGQINLGGMNFDQFKTDEAQWENLVKTGQAEMAAITAESEARLAAIRAKGEAEITSIVAEGEVRRQAILQENAAKQLLITEKLNSELVRQQKLLQERSMFGGSMLGKHVAWLAGTYAIFETLALAKEGIVDMEKAMKGLQTVLPELHENQEAYNEAEEKAIDLMQEYGATLDEVMTAGRSFGRMYKDLDTVMALVDNSIKLNVVDNLALEDAVAANEAALMVYGKELKSYNEVLSFSNHLTDAFTRLTHESAVSAKDLADILSRSAAAAKNAGVSLDELLGIGTAAKRSTMLQGSNVGNMLKTVFAQLSNPSTEVIQSLNEVGVAVHNANGELRNAYDIILDLSLATKDASFSQEELNDAISKMASGKFQYSKTAALLGQFDEIVKNTARSINSQGVTIKMMEQQLDTVDRKAKQLRATLIETFAGIGDSGLREVIKNMLDVINQFIMGLNNIPAGVITAGLAIGGLVLAGKLLTSVFYALIPTITIVTGATAATGIAMKGMAASELFLTAATGGLETAMAGLATSTAIATGGLTLLVGILAVLIYKVGAADKKQQEHLQTLEQEIALNRQRDEQTKSTIDFLSTLEEKYTQLNQKVATSAKGTKEHTDAVKNLNAVKEAVIMVTDDETKKELGLTDVRTAQSKVTLDLIKKSSNSKKKNGNK